MLTTRRLEYATHAAEVLRKVTSGTQYCVPEVDLRWTDGAEDLDPQAVWRLLRTTYWAATRDLETVQSYLREASLLVAAHRDGDLVALSRIVQVQRKVNWLFDVVVSDSERGRGRGTQLMRRILSHPALSDITRLFLDTKDAMPFYRRFGFRELDVVAGSTLMVWHRPQSA